MNIGFIGDFLTVKGGKRLPKGSKFSESKTKYPYVRVTDFERNSLDESGLKYISKEIQEKISRYTIQSSDVYISIAGTIGIAGIIPDYLNGANLTENAAKLAPKEGVDLLPKYLSYFLNSPDTQAIIKSKTMAVGVPKLALFRIQEIPLRLPPLDQQKKIAAILDTADTYRQKTKALIAKYDELTQSLFLDMFGDPVTNPKGWEQKPMGELMTVVRGGSPRPIDKFLGGTYPWIKIGDATKGDDIYLKKTKQHIIAEGLSKTRLLPKGSLIFANCGVSLGFARIIQFEGCIHDGWLAFSDLDNNILNEMFLLKSLNSVTQYFRDTAPDGTQPNLNSTIMKSFKMILPPIESQNKFERNLKVLTEQKTQAKASLDKAENLFNSLLQRAFKGELV